MVMVRAAWHAATVLVVAECLGGEKRKKETRWVDEMRCTTALALKKVVHGRSIIMHR